jgi:hypothetical protein
MGVTQPSRALLKKAAYQSTPKTNAHRTKQAERHLYRLLDKICVAAGLQLSEWVLNKHLFDAILASTEASSEKALKSYEIYDECFLLLKAVGISVDHSFTWFTNLKQLVNNNKN